MNSQWNSFLQTQSAGSGENRGVERGRNGADQACALIDLSHLGLIGLEGEDAESFLQGQMTNDVRSLTADHFQISACCSPKGRMLANFLVFRHRQKIVLQMPRDIQQILLKRFPMYILMSRTKVTDASDGLVCVGLLGESAQALLQLHFNRVPATAWDAVQENGFTLLRHPGETPRIEIVGEPDAMMTLWEKLARSTIHGTSGRWTLEDIRAGIPTLHGSTSESFLPQMTNMDLIDGVSFTKGCYTGQEVVARTRYLGKIKRRMYLARIEGDRCPQPGEELYSADSDSGQGPGRVVDAQVSPDGGCEMLAVIEISSHDNGNIHIGGENGEKLQFRALPYSLEQA